jgi:hypothetical protein
MEANSRREEMLCGKWQELEAKTDCPGVKVLKAYQ